MIPQRFFAFFFSLSFIVCSISFSQKAISSQPAELTILGKTTSPVSDVLAKNEILLLNTSGNIVGKIKGVAKEGEFDTEKMISVMLDNGSQFFVDPLQSITVSEKIKYIAIYGDHWDYDKPYKMYIKIYDSNGEEKLSLDPELYWPYDIKLLDDGSFIAAGKKDRIEKTTYLRKYSLSGQMDWETSIQDGDLKSLEIAHDERNVAILTHNQDNYGKQLLIYSISGSQVYRDEHPEYFSDVEFIADSKLMIYSHHDWIIYDLNNNVKKSARGTFNNKLIGRKPITGFSNGEKFCVLNSSKDGNKYLLQVFDSITGKTLNEQEIEGPVTWKNFRTIRERENNTLNLINENISFSFTVN